MAAGAAMAEPEGKPAAGFAGQFLASHFAQSQNDWKAANGFLDSVLQTDPRNFELLRRSMVLAMGTGEIDLAARRAEGLLAIEPENSLAMMILVINDVHAGRLDEAATRLAAMPEGDVTDFIKPMIKGWIEAPKGVFDMTAYNITSVHSYNAGLLALHLGRKDDAAALAAKMVATGDLSPFDYERAGDLFAAAGRKDEALAAYQGAFDQGVTDRELDDKAAAVKEGGEKAKEFTDALQIKTPAEGLAVAMFDMARILFQEESDSSSKVFAHMALVLDPGLIEARLLLANMMVRNGRYNEAIEYFSSIGKETKGWIEIQRHMAGLLQEAGRTEEALTLLNQLFAEHNDIESLIRIGDIHRNEMDYAGALQAYNKAAGTIGEKIPEDYWHLLYARGMAYEREGNWDRAEADLKAALGYRPDHPYLLNYLAYGWADQGKNLPESLELIERAAELRPGDGYIRDSLGWVLYRMDRYSEAVPHLEKAVELLPYDATLNEHLGDAYWQVGRELEARFQWERALNNADADETMKAALSTKLKEGLRNAQTLKEARTLAGGEAQAQ